MVEYPAPLIRHGHFPAVGLFCLSMKLSLMIVKYYVFKSVWFCLVYDWIPLLAVYVHMMFLNLNFGKMVFVVIAAVAATVIEEEHMACLD